MTDALDRRREFYERLADHPLVDEADFSRDGFKTVVLELVDDPPENHSTEYPLVYRNIGPWQIHKSKKTGQCDTSATNAKRGFVRQNPTKVMFAPIVGELWINTLVRTAGNPQATDTKRVRET